MEFLLSLIEIGLIELKLKDTNDHVLVPFLRSLFCNKPSVHIYIILETKAP